MSPMGSSVHPERGTEGRPGVGEMLSAWEETQEEVVLRWGPEVMDRIRREVGKCWKRTTRDFYFEVRKI